jgi:hypothetical protein
MSYYDSNYGHWEDCDPADYEETEAFRRNVEQNSVWKTCKICGEQVKIQRHYDKCDSCCRLIENGWQF